MKFSASLQCPDVLAFFMAFLKFAEKLLFDWRLCPLWKINSLNLPAWSLLPTLLWTLPSLFEGKEWNLCLRAVITQGSQSLFWSLKIDWVGLWETSKKESRATLLIHLLAAGLQIQSFRNLAEYQITCFQFLGRMVCIHQTRMFSLSRQWIQTFSFANSFLKGFLWGLTAWEIWLN